LSIGVIKNVHYLVAILVCVDDTGTGAADVGAVSMQKIAFISVNCGPIRTPITTNHWHSGNWIAKLAEIIFKTQKVGVNRADALQPAGPHLLSTDTVSSNKLPFTTCGIHVPILLIKKHPDTVSGIRK
jgi:hypothetical protein